MKTYLKCLVLVALVASLLTFPGKSESQTNNQHAESTQAVNTAVAAEKPIEAPQATPTPPVEQPVESVQKPPEPTPVAVAGCDLVNNYSNWDQRVARAVCMAESGGNTYAANTTDNHGRCKGSFGLMQLACFWIPNPYDPVANMAKANEIYTRSGWAPWGAYTSGKYLRYL